ncbi:cytochrome b5 domain-containing protein, partial [Nesterenkonia aurantiaca]|uniref:cytochrome b5 domain-containing protein n=1 Tax=Nesterenkonia aurantiaca TaxID=1436010 RepID=UPI003EE786E2
MTTLTRKPNWRQALLVPVAAGSMLVLSACGQSADEAQEAPEPETAQDTEAPEETEASQETETPQETSPDQTETAPAEGENTEAEEDTTEGYEAEGEQDSSDEALTMDQVEENDSPESCWAVMDGTVYDLTDWIEDHPGGADRIEGLCGTD